MFYLLFPLWLDLSTQHVSHKLLGRRWLDCHFEWWYSEIVYYYSILVANIKLTDSRDLSSFHPIGSRLLYFNTHFSFHWDQNTTINLLRSIDWTLKSQIDSWQWGHFDLLENLLPHLSKMLFTHHLVLKILWSMVHFHLCCTGLKSILYSLQKNSLWHRIPHQSKSLSAAGNNRHSRTTKIVF